MMKDIFSTQFLLEQFIFDAMEGASKGLQLQKFKNFADTK